MKLSEHFTLDELIWSDTAARLRIDNAPDPIATSHLVAFADGLENVRSILGGRPIRINSGYRCEQLNRAIGGARNSAHLIGYAADFTCREFGAPLQIVRALQQGSIDFDQVIQEGSWVHVSFAPMSRRQVLTAHFGPGGTTYTMGA